MPSAQTAEKPETAQEVTLEEALKLAKGHHQTGNFMLADRTYRDILRAVPDHFPTTQLLGVLLFQTGNYEDAATYLEKAVHSAPDDKQVLNNYGGVLTQLGRYEEALTYYDKALAIDPDFTDSLNNKCYAFWCLERYEEAESIARRVLESAPEDLSALTNLGITLARRNRYEESLNVWKKASTLNPGDWQIWSNWGNALREINRIAQAEKKCRRAVELAPKNPEALNNLANALRDLGRSEEAIEYYNMATDIRPDYMHAHSNKAIAYLDMLNFDRAAVAARYAIAFDDKYVAAYINLSAALLELGDFNAANAYAQKAILLDKENPDAYLHLADVLLRADRLEDSAATIDEALKRNPDSPRTYLKLSEIRDRLVDFEGALEAINEALKMAPDMAHLHLHKARLLKHNNEIDKALKCVNKAIELAPHNLGAILSRSEIYISINELDKAEKGVRQALEHDNMLPMAYTALCNIKKFKSEDDEDFIRLKEISENAEKYGLEGAAAIHFTLSNAYEHMKEYDKAFSHLEKANDLKRQTIPYDASKQPATFVSIKNGSSKEKLAEMMGGGYESDIPVFIVGMPRSGTTLTEQIISSHPDVFGAGELSILGYLRKLHVTGEVTDLEELGRMYVEQVKKLDKSGKALRITDKMPGNYMSVGFIASILPNAKIIHTKRNPIDTCLSCYKQNFARGQYWSYNQEELAAEYKRYLDLMEHWRTVLPGRMLEIEYKDTVSDLETQARKLIDFIGMPWDDACLEPHKQKRAVLTASKQQVTKPVYTSSVEKWRRYEKYLQPLVRELQPEDAL